MRAFNFHLWLHSEIRSYWITQIFLNGLFGKQIIHNRLQFIWRSIIQLQNIIIKILKNVEENSCKSIRYFKLFLSPKNELFFNKTLFFLCLIASLFHPRHVPLKKSSIDLGEKWPEHILGHNQVPDLFPFPKQFSLISMAWLWLWL